MPWNQNFFLWYVHIKVYNFCLLTTNININKKRVYLLFNTKIGYFVLCKAAYFMGCLVNSKSYT